MSRTRLEFVASMVDSRNGNWKLKGDGNVVVAVDNIAKFVRMVLNKNINIKKWL